MSDAETKACTRCKAEKPRDCFSTDRSARDGLKHWCKACCKEHVDKDRDAHRELVRRNYRANPEAYVERKRRWRSENRDRENEQARRYRAKNPEAALKAQRKYRATHREACLQRTRSWAERNPERVRLNLKNKQHKRRARKKGGMSGPEFQQWVKAQRKVCHWCGTKCPDHYHVDHRVPLAKGGKHEARNLVIACQPCNQRKASRCPVEFAQSMGRLL